ncbi:uncharacterized protein BJ212DRAFT_1482176 [Suillus subaureus]|uniref:Uncharacterized protein n=1 Tax=Suillus subaureus TaxID=48587 RepID=A0A9P7JCG2_9AGAM|nr:uncharacterized protein BJ212DRAFT_1482176 [Suillus subaureus]KAG1814442.1 hypothetical protein BJ212DRAFT_1482176 [Suillus subaureus]
MFDKYLHIETEGQKQGYTTGNIRLLQGLADRLMGLAQAGGEINEDEHPEDSENEGVKLNYPFTPEQQGRFNELHEWYRMSLLEAQRIVGIKDSELNSINHHAQKILYIGG